MKKSETWRKSDPLIKMGEEGKKFVITSRNRTEEIELHSFKVGMFSKDRPGSFAGVMGPINMYLDENIDIKDEVGDLLFQSGKIVNDVIIKTLDLEINMSKLADILLKESSKIREFILEKGVFLPEDNSDKEWASENKTYNRDAYIDLMVLSVILSLFVPIWGIYMYRIKNLIGTLYSETSAMSLLRHSDTEATEVMKKLMIYVTSIDQNSDKTQSILQHSCSDDAVIALGMRSAVRKVAVHDISLEAGSNMISSIHKMVSSNQSGRAAFFKDKNTSLKGSDSDGSYTDSFVISQSISAGEIQELRFACSNPREIAGNIFPGDKYSRKELSNNLSFYSELQADQICPAKETILKWIFCGAIISSSGLDYLLMEHIRNLMAVARTFLHTFDHVFLELLMTSKHRSSSSSIHIGGTASRNRLPQEIADLLDITHPYKKKSGGIKKNVLKNIATEAIDDLISELLRNQYTPGCIELEKRLVSSSTHGVLTMPRNIKEILALLILKIEGTRSCILEESQFPRLP